MKAQILKIAGVKSEKEFYKKYPSEAAFMKKHGKEFKKAQTGTAINKAQNFGNLDDKNRNGIPDAIENPYNINSPRFGQTANYGDTQGYQSQPIYLQKPPVINDENFQPIVEGYPRQTYTDAEIAKQNEEIIDPSTVAKKSSKTGKTGKGPSIQAIGNVASGFLGGLQEIGREKEITKNAEAFAGASNVVKDAAISNAFVKKEPNKYFDPSDPRFVKNTSELTFQQGRGTDVLNSQNGGGIGGNPTQVSNNYGPDYTLFDDLGYEPLQNENKVKAYQGGGMFGSFGQGSPFDSLIGSSFGNSGGYQVGSSLGSIFGPAGSFAGGVIGGIFDDEPRKAASAMGTIRGNNDFIGNLAYGNNVHSQFSPNMKNGGYMNPEYNPQVIAMFGDHNADDFADYAHKYRAGGHLKEYTAPSERAMQTYENGGEMTSYAMGGKLQTHWGGEVNTIAYNPYLPGSGEIGMLSGASHDNGGIGISYNGGEDGYQSMAANGAEMGAQVEAETREPIIEMAEGGSIDPKTGKANTSAVIFGNIPFSKKLANATGDEALIKLGKEKDGKTYKKIIADFAKPQKRAEQTIIKASEIANDADKTKWGALDIKTAEMMELGGKLTQKDYANTIMKLANLQNAIQDVKKEKSYDLGYNISAEELGKSGNVKTDYDEITKDAELENPYAKSGAYLRKAQTGFAEGFGVDSEGYNYDYNETPDELVATNNPGNANVVTPIDNTSDDKNYVSKYGIVPWEGNSKESKYGKATKSSFSAKQWDKIADKLGFKGKGNKEFQEFLLNNPQSSPLIKARHQKLYGKDPWVDPEHFGYGWAADELLLSPPAEIPTDTTGKQTTQAPKDTNVIPYERNKAIDIANMLLPFFRNNNDTPLDPRQLAGEYMAIAQNQEEPVPSQSMRYDLDPVYRITNQEVRNQSTSDFRDALRMNQFDPAAAASIFGRKAVADQASYADEFRTNQAIEQQIFGGNRAKMNQERATNIQLNADQMSKQALAKSKTKETQQAAIASIADKYLQHDARNLENNVYKNMYDQYGFDSSGRIHNQGPLYQPNIPQVYGGKASFKQVPIYGPNGEITGYKLEPNNTSETKVAKNGGALKKNYKNSSVVRAFKNL
jgi:hypothetical protein